MEQLDPFIQICALAVNLGFRVNWQGNVIILEKEKR